MNLEIIAISVIGWLLFGFLIVIVAAWMDGELLTKHLFLSLYGPFLLIVCIFVAIESKWNTVLWKRK